MRQAIYERNANFRTHEEVLARRVYGRSVCLNKLRLNEITIVIVGNRQGPRWQYEESNLGDYDLHDYY